MNKRAKGFAAFICILLILASLSACGSKIVADRDKIVAKLNEVLSSSEYHGKDADGKRKMITNALAGDNLIERKFIKYIKSENKLMIQDGENVNIILDLNEKDKTELNNQIMANSSIQGLLSSDEYRNGSVEWRLEALMKVLENAADLGLVVKDSIQYDETNKVVSFEYNNHSRSLIHLDYDFSSEN